MTEFPIHTAGPAFEEPWSKKDVDEAFAQLRFSTVRLDAILRDNNLALVELASLLLEVRQAKRELSDLEKLAEDVLGEAMAEPLILLDGIGRLKRSHRRDRTEWDKEQLLADVLDTRLVNKDTGEVVEETPLDRVLSVWNLGSPRLTILRERGLDPDDYCSVSKQDGWSVRVDS